MSSLPSDERTPRAAEYRMRAVAWSTSYAGRPPTHQFFDGLFWNNKLSTKYGVNSIPATYLLDGEGKIIGKNLRGEALEAAVAKALGKS